MTTAFVPSATTASPGEDFVRTPSPRLLRLRWKIMASTASSSMKMMRNCMTREEYAEYDESSAA